MDDCANIVDEIQFYPFSCDPCAFKAANHFINQKTKKLLS